MEQKSIKAKSFFEKASVYLANRPSIRLRCRIVRDLLGNISGREILDIGCGDGSLTVGFIENNHITFLDFSSAMLKAVRENIPETYQHHASTLQVNFEDHAFDRSFDIILCVGVLAHVQDINQSIARLAGILKSSGRIILQVSDNSHWYYRLQATFKKQHNQYGYSLNKISPAELTAKAASYEMVFERSCKYPSAFSFARFFGNRFTYRFMYYVCRNRFLGFLASEHVLMFRKK